MTDDDRKADFLTKLRLRKTKNKGPLHFAEVVKDR
jgi:hypothetical protein